MHKKNNKKTTIKILFVILNLGFTFIFFNGECTSDIKTLNKESISTNQNSNSIIKNLDGEISYNLIIGDPCYLLSKEKKSSVFKRLYQFENKMLSFNTYDQKSQKGTYTCTSDNYLEPYLFNGSFSCSNNGIYFSESELEKLRGQCRNYKTREVKCAQFNDDFQNDIYQINNTRFKFNNSIYSFDQTSSDNNSNFIGSEELANLTNVLSSQVQSPTTLQNTFLMSAMVCSAVNGASVTNVSDFCLEYPNHPSCYGKFNDKFVNFPDMYFPAHEGPWSSQAPGYNGESHLPADTDSKWSYFEFKTIGANHKLTTSIGVRFDPTININNFQNLSSKTMNPFNPQNPGNLPQVSLDDFGKISSYYYQAARSEILNMTSLDRKGRAQYYYDHIPRQFLGFGAKLSSHKNTGVFDSSSNHHFQAFCDNGCKNLVLTSHETCDSEYANTPADTEVHCLPKYLNIRINHLAKIDPDVFYISGYESVEVKDLVITITPSTKPLEIREKILNNQLLTTQYLDYLLPRLSYHFLSDGSVKNYGIESTRDEASILLDNEYIINFNNILHNYTFSSFNDYVKDIPKWILVKGETQNYGPIQLASLINFNLRKPNFFCYDSLLNINENVSLNLKDCPGNYPNIKACISNEVRNNCGANNFLASFVGNLLMFQPAYFNSTKRYFTLQKRAFNIHQVDKFVLSNTLYRAVTQAAFHIGARKSIIHGNHFEGFNLGDLINRNLPLESSNIGISSYYGQSNEINFDELYFAPIFINTGNNEGHVRLDESRRALFKMDYLSEFPRLNNLCQAVDGTNPNPTYCDPVYNFKENHKFTVEEYFSPFYYATDGPEERAKRDGAIFNHYSNDLYLKKFNPSLRPSFLVSLDRSPASTPMQINSSGVRVINDFATCNTNTDCGTDGYCHSEDDYPNGICLNGNLRAKYTIVSNSTFQNHSFRWIDFKVLDSSDTRASYNHDFIATNGTHALIFNNLLQNSESDIYDFNFRATHYRSEENKNLIQVIERNIIANGSNGKTTGEGNPESKMRFSNNIIKDVRIGGYHAFFKPFYLNNTLLSGAHAILNDTQSGHLNVEALKPYGVRHTLFNNAVIRSRLRSELIRSSNLRPKQHSFDYNLSHNLYLGDFSSNWFIGLDGSSLDISNYNKNLPILNYDYGVDNFGNQLGCLDNLLISSAEDNSCDSPVSFDLSDPSELSDMLRGSFSNYTYNSSKNDGYNYGRLLQRDLDSGETVLYGYTPNLDDFSLSKIKIDKTIPRVHFIAQYCFNQHDLSSPLNPIAFSDILADVASSYSCITGDNTSTVITQDELNNSNFDVYHAVDSAFETLSNQSITNVIMQNLGGKAKCNSLEKHISENKSPSIMVNNKGLSVYRDFQGNYRSPTSSSGAIDIHCSDD